MRIDGTAEKVFLQINYINYNSPSKQVKPRGAIW